MYKRARSQDCRQTQRGLRQNLSIAATMNSMVNVFLVCVLLFCAQAQPGNRSSKCKCANSFIGRVNSQLIKTEPVIYQPTIFCPNTEIIVRIANGEKCVNPQSRAGKLILKNKQRQKRSYENDDSFHSE